MIGKNCGLDLTNPTILFVNIWSVPFSYAIPNIKVIPTNIKNRFAGNSSGISFSLRPRTNIPIAYANAIAITPILMFGFTIPSTITITKAVSERTAISIMLGLLCKSYIIHPLMVAITPPTFEDYPKIQMHQKELLLQYLKHYQPILA